MQENENIQESVLFDGSVSCINISSNDSNIVHKKTVTSTIHNNTIKQQNSKNRIHIMASQA